MKQCRQLFVVLHLERLAIERHGHRVRGTVADHYAVLLGIRLRGRGRTGATHSVPDLGKVIEAAQHHRHPLQYKFPSIQIPCHTNSLPYKNPAIQIPCNTYHGHVRIGFTFPTRQLQLQIINCVQQLLRARVRSIGTAACAGHCLRSPVEHNAIHDIAPVHRGRILAAM